MTIPYIRSEYLKVIPEKEIKKLHKACQAEYPLLWLTSHLPVTGRKQNELFGCILNESGCVYLRDYSGLRWLSHSTPGPFLTTSAAAASSTKRHVVKREIKGRDF